jgi:hypothetical protein
MIGSILISDIVTAEQRTGCIRRESVVPVEIVSGFGDPYCFTVIRMNCSRVI